MDFIIGLPISTNKKSNNYNFILVIIARLTKIIYYKPVKVMINIPGQAKVIINMFVYHHGVSKSIIMNRDLLFISKFWSSLYCFLQIQKRYSQPFTRKWMTRQKDKIAY